MIEHGHLAVNVAPLEIGFRHLIPERRGAFPVNSRIIIVVKRPIRSRPTLISRRQLQADLDELVVTGQVILVVADSAIMPLRPGFGLDPGGVDLTFVAIDNDVASRNRFFGSFVGTLRTNSFGIELGLRRRPAVRHDRTIGLYRHSRNPTRRAESRCLRHGLREFGDTPISGSGW